MAAAVKVVSPMKSVRNSGVTPPPPATLKAVTSGSSQPWPKVGTGYWSPPFDR